MNEETDTYKGPTLAELDGLTAEHLVNVACVALHLAGCKVEDLAGYGSAESERVLVVFDAAAELHRVMTPDLIKEVR